MKDIKKKDDKGLVSFIAEKREEIRAQRFGVGTRNVKALRTAKKEVAQALFELSHREKTNNSLS